MKPFDTARPLWGGARLALCLAVRIALKNTLTILKIDAPETM